MTFIELLQQGNIKEAYQQLKAKEGVIENAKEYNNDRTIRKTQVGKRQDKIGKDGDIETVAKIPIPFQNQIVLTASTFLFGSAVNLVNSSKQEEVFDKVKDLWDDLRLDSLLLDFCQAVKSETEATIIFYPKKKETETKIKVRLLTSENGKVYPVFDEFGDLVAFSWEYGATENGKEVKYLYVWTDETERKYRLEKEWKEVHKKPNLFRKIPVVYLSQKHTEWWRVQELIDNFEMSFSKFVDTNGYFASPMFKAKGYVSKELKAIPKKDETGQMVELGIVETKNGNIITADLDVISWDRAPEALKLEFETSKELIYALSNTPDISFDNVKGIGSVSGIALKLMFLGSILKAKKDEGKYQVVISRLISLLKSSLLINEPLLQNDLKELRIKVEFTSVLPENLQETISMLSNATGGKSIMSQKTAVNSNPLVENKEEEMKALEEEKNKTLFDE